MASTATLKKSKKTSRPAGKTARHTATKRTSNGAYAELLSLIKQASLLGSSASILSWDQETMMPPKGVEHRSRQMAQIAKLSHEMATSKRLGELLAECEADSKLMKDPRSVEAVNVREFRHEYNR